MFRLPLEKVEAEGICQKGRKIQKKQTARKNVKSEASVSVLLEPIKKIRVSFTKVFSHRQHILFLVFSASVFVLLDCTAAFSCDMSALPSEIRLYLNKELPSWKVVTLDDLAPEDRKFFVEKHPDGCPGYTSGSYTSAGTTLFAVVVISGSKPPLRTKLLVFSRGKKGYREETLWQVPNAAFPPVVFTMPPGTYQSWERDRQVRAKHPVIFYVHFESSGAMFYWSKGKWQMLQVSG